MLSIVFSIVVLFCPAAVGDSGPHSHCFFEMSRKFSPPRKEIYQKRHTYFIQKSDVVNYAFVRLAPSLASHHCPIEATSGCDVPSDVNSFTLQHNPDIDVTWSIESQLNNGNMVHTAKEHGVKAYRTWLERPVEDNTSTSELTMRVEKTGTTTGIYSVVEENGNTNNAVYDLNGIRQSNASMHHGVYITNGKKYTRK